MQKVAISHHSPSTITSSHPKNGSVNTSQRLLMIQSGARNFLSKIKTILSADSKWTLAIVCLNEAPIPAAKTDSVSLQAKKYLQYQLWQKSQKINHDRADWVKIMKNQ